MAQLTEHDYWRAVILFGLNTATYKIALGYCLAEFAKSGKSDISMQELARSFFDLYRDRLKTNQPQLSTPDRQTVMERIVGLHRVERLTYEESVSKVEREAFGDVLPRFHTVDQRVLPVAFYEHTGKALVLHDNLFTVFSSDESSLLLEELKSRWDLLEAAFQIRRDNSMIVNDIRQFYLQKAYNRTDVTWTKPALQGYQKGCCFYCGERMGESSVHVDHVIPRQLVRHDDIWNLVLAHSFCNVQKSDSIPPATYIVKLIERNEYLIASNHPIKNALLAQLGSTAAQRGGFVWDVYQDARTVIRYTWEGIRGYKPESDPFYRTFVRGF